MVVCTVLVSLAGCGQADGQALQKLACQHAANSIDLQSVGQVDSLRKALGVAPGIDPLQTCRALGVAMDPNNLPEARSGQASGQPSQRSGPASSIHGEPSTEQN